METIVRAAIEEMMDYQFNYFDHENYINPHLKHFEKPGSSTLTKIVACITTQEMFAVLCAVTEELYNIGTICDYMKSSFRWTAQKMKDGLATRSTETSESSEINLNTLVDDALEKRSSEVQFASVEFCTPKANIKKGKHVEAVETCYNEFKTRTPHARDNFIRDLMAVCS